MILIKSNKKAKQIIAGAVALTLSISLCACGASSKGYDEVKASQANMLTLESGKFTINSSYQTGEKSEAIKSEFVFSTGTDKKFSYCQTQYDNSKKPVYCDFSDGAAASQWFIGKGWSNATLLDYSSENPHRYIKLLSTTPNKDTVKGIECIEQGDKKIYKLEMNPASLNETNYKNTDLEVKSQRIEITLTAEKFISNYHDTSVLVDKNSGEETVYGLDVAVSETNAVLEVTKPDLRDYGIKANADVDEK